ncbi:hypothetical protein E3U43_022061 [Xyrichtys novacula]|uniref:Uncharacterized protein n=1 Tax=Xyrichtys novacula TaxID=13765 RepID=A0AAV1GUY4_XYRNO|nr:hypothetical protein E3U43_022061 [Xyrichtys novacula]
MLTVSLGTLGLQAELFPIIAALREGASAPYDTAVTLSSETGKKKRKNFCMTSTEQNIVTSETSVWDECHKCNIDCHIAVHAVSCLPLLPPTQDISTDTQPSLCQKGLLARSHKDLERYTSSSLHTKSCSLKLQRWSQSYASLIVQYV